MASIERALAAVYADRGLAAYGYALAGSVSAGAALVRAGAVQAASRRPRLSGDLVHATRTHMVTLQCAVLRRGPAPQARTAEQADTTSDAAYAPPTRDTGSSPASTGDGEVELSAVDRALAQLDPWVRVAMVLRYRDDRDVAAVARALHLPIRRVESLLADGRNALAASVGISAEDVARMDVGDGT